MEISTRGANCVTVIKIYRSIEMEIRFDIPYFYSAPPVNRSLSQRVTTPISSYAVLYTEISMA